MSEVTQEQRIERSIEVSAPIDRVWKLMTTGSELPRWWHSMDSAEVDLVPGGAMTFRWKKSEHGISAGQVIEVEEPHLFSWYWASNSEGRPPSEGDRTLVEFRLEELGEITRVTVSESGFESLSIPPEERMTSLEGNTQGWGEVLDHLRAEFA
jgi:uncharacterized protein YndB with AHSA1/START domain